MGALSHQCIDFIYTSRHRQSRLLMKFSCRLRAKPVNAPMASPISLPDEILILTFSYLEPLHDNTTVRALRLVSAQFNRLSTPLVYCTITDCINQHRHLNKPEVGPLQRAAWDIVQYSERAVLVKVIKFDDWDFIGRDKTSPLPEGVLGPSYEQYAAALAAAHLPDDVHHAILKQLLAETPAGHLSLLIALCGKLEVLRSPSGYGPFGSLVARILFRSNEDASFIALPPSPQTLSSISLGCLKELHIGNFYHDSALKHILPLLCLPDLHHLAAYGLGDSHVWSDHTLPDQPNDYLTEAPITLTFDSCMLSGAGLSRILSSCKRPKALTIRWRPGFWNDHLSNEPIGDAIRSHGGNLEHLHIDSTAVYKHRRSVIPPSFGSFASLTNLKTLVVPRFAFAREDCRVEDIVSVLPSTLEELYVLGVGNEKSYEEGIESGIFTKTCEQAQQVLPSLTKVVMIPWHHFSIEESFGPISHQCVDYNVEEEPSLSLKRISELL